MYITILKLYFENLIITYSKLLAIGIEIIPANAYLEYFNCGERMSLGLCDSLVTLSENF